MVVRVIRIKEPVVLTYQRTMVASSRDVHIVMVLKPMLCWVAVSFRAEYLGEEPESDFPQIPQLMSHVALKSPCF